MQRSGEWQKIYWISPKFENPVQILHIFFQLLTKNFGLLKEKRVGGQDGRKRREREGREGAKEVGRKKMEKTSLILYTKSWPKAKCQQATYKQKSKMERLRNLTIAT